MTTGLLLVHGIGNQSRATVLTTACDELVGWLRDRYGDDEVIYGPTQLRLGEDDSQGPPTARIDVRDRASIVVAESRWAESFIAPSYGKITGWLLVAVTRVARHEIGNLLGRLTAPDPPDLGGPFAPGRPYPPSRISRIFNAFWLLAALPLALTVILATAGLRIFPPARGLATAVQRALSGTIGDAFVFCQDLTGRAAIVQQVRRDIEWLSKQGVDRIVVAAHSQGAAVTHEALSFCTNTHNSSSTCCRCEGTVDLVTYGSGLDKLTALSAPMTARSVLGLIVTSAASLLAGSSLVAVGFTVADVLGRIDQQSGILHAAQRFGFARRCASDCGRETAQSVALAVALVSMGLALVVLLAWAGATHIQFLRRWPWRRLFLSGLIVLICLGCVGLFLLNSVAFVGFVVAAVTALLSLMIGFFCLRHPARQHKRPRRVSTWIDVKASADPVASSALLMNPERIDLVIHNRRSLALDHTTYWQNWAEFVPAVLNTLALGDGPDLDVPRAWLAGERSRLFELTWMLSGARIFMTAAFGALLIAVITDLPAVGGWLVDRYADAVAPFGRDNVDVDSQLARIGVAVAAVAVVSALAYLVFVAGWKGWQRIHRRRRVGELRLLAETSSVCWDDWRAFSRCRRHGAGPVTEGWLAVRCGPPGDRNVERVWVADGTREPGGGLTVAAELISGKSWRRGHVLIREVGTGISYAMRASRARAFLLSVSGDAEYR